MRFRSRPSEVEAIQWTDDNLQDVLEFGLNVTRYEHNLGRLMLLAGKDGAQGWVSVPLGHWIVRKPGDLTDHWPVDPDYFNSKYERVMAVSDQNRMMMEFSARVDALARVVRDAWSDPDVECPDWPTLRHVCVLALIDGRGKTLAALGHDDCVAREYVDMRVSDATEQHARDAEQQHDRAKRAEADAERLHQDLDHCAGTAEHLEAERDRLRDLVEEFLEQHPSGEHWQATAEGGPAGWCAECLAEWPCLFERARAALDARDAEQQHDRAKRAEAERDRYREAHDALLDRAREAIAAWWEGHGDLDQALADLKQTVHAITDPRAALDGGER